MLCEIRIALSLLPMFWFVPGARVQDSSSPKPAGADKSEIISIAMPGGDAGIGFDDLRFSRELGRVLVPSGRTGKLNLVDPSTRAVESISGFGAKEGYAGGHGDGTTSVDEGGSFLFAIDRTATKLHVVDPHAKAIVASVPLAGDPDYVRFVASGGEVWVTEPDAEQIEVFSLTATKPPAPTHTDVIRVEGGPESLVIDASRGRAYTHLWKGSTVAIDLKTRTIIAHWKNGCSGSRGMALDEKRGFLFVGCAEGRATVLDVVHDGKQLSSLEVGAGVDIIDYDAKRAHLYVPGGQAASMAILGVSAKGELFLLATIPTASGCHCVTTDQSGHAFVGDQHGGRLLVVRDAYPDGGS